MAQAARSADRGRGVLVVVDARVEQVGDLVGLMSVVCRVFGWHGWSLPSHSFTYGDSRSMETVPFHAAPTMPYLGSL